MKKFLMFAMAIGVFLFTAVGSSVAAPVDVPSAVMFGQSDQGSITAGLEADFLTKRELKLKDSGIAETGDFEGSVFSLKIGGTFENFDLYGKIGQILSPEIKDDSAKIALDNGMAFGVGVNGVLFQDEYLGLSLFGDAKFNMIPKLEVSSPADLGWSKGEIKYTEWQVALGISKRIDQFVPYGGVMYSDVVAELEASVGGFTGTADLESKDNFGFFVGCGWAASENISVELEGRFLADQAVTLKAGYKF